MACAGASDSPQAAAKAFVKQLYAGDGDAALKLVYMPEGGRPGTAERLQGKVRAGAAEAKAKADELGGLKDIEIAATQLSPNDPNRARIELRLVFGSGEKKEHVNTIKVDGKWLVRMM